MCSVPEHPILFFQLLHPYHPRKRRLPKADRCDFLFSRQIRKIFEHRIRLCRTVSRTDGLTGRICSDGASGPLYRPAVRCLYLSVYLPAGTAPAPSGLSHLKQFHPNLHIKSSCIFQISRFGRFEHIHAVALLLHFKTDSEAAVAPDLIIHNAGRLLRC